MRSRTVITFAHWLSTIENAYRMALRGEGRIVEEGHYQELLGLKGHLWEFHRFHRFQAA